MDLKFILAESFLEAFNTVFKDSDLEKILIWGALPVAKPPDKT